MESLLDALGPAPPSLLDGLTPEQAEVVAHDRGPLVVLGAAGTGKTRALLARFAALVRGGAAPESVLLLARTPAAADDHRRALETELSGGWEELLVVTPRGLCARLLDEAAAAAGLDPLAEPVTRADRLALLLDRLDELVLREHDFAGSAAGLVGSALARIDRLKGEGVTAAAYAAWAAALPDGDPGTAREREFAALYAAHDRMLEEAAALDDAGLVLRALDLLGTRPDIGARLARRVPHVLVDEVEDLPWTEMQLVRRLARAHESLVGAANPDAAVRRVRAAAHRNTDVLGREEGAPAVRLTRPLRVPDPAATAASAVLAPLRGDDAPAGEPPVPAARGTAEVAFWRCAGERAQAQAVAADLERRMLAGLAPERVAVLVRSVRHEGQAVAMALEERAIPFRVHGAAALFDQAEVRDVVAWLRLLSEPSEAAAGLRALARPPIALAAPDLARVTQIARRRKLDMVAAAAAATEAPQIAPEAREKLLQFLKLHRSAAAALDTMRADLFVHRLVDRLGLRRQHVYAAQPEVVERLRGLARLVALAAAFARRQPHATAREFARTISAVAEAGTSDGQDADREPGDLAGAVQILSMEAAKGVEVDRAYVLGLQAARLPGARRRPSGPLPDALLAEPLPPSSRDAHVAETRRLLGVALTRARDGVVLAHAGQGPDGAVQPPSPFAEEARLALGAAWEDRDEQLHGPSEVLHATFRALRDELLADVAHVGRRLGELRLDTDLDVSHAVARYLELVKVAALLERAPGRGLRETLDELNPRLGGAATPEVREILASSGLDDLLLDAERGDRRRERALAAREEPSLEAFLPRRGDGLALSASDIETYRVCPLKYKFARVLRVPQEPTLNQRFGIAVHQVLERFHGGAATHGSLAELLGLLDTAWRRGGFGDSDEERQLRAKATAALTHYHERVGEEPSKPVWFERPFEFGIGPHRLRGRVDRVDELPDGGYELIDYKTGRPRSAGQLRDDVQLSLYAIAARESWGVDSPLQSYLYVLDDVKVAVPHGEADRVAVEDTVAQVADGILGQSFEPTPSYAACAMCDFRLACPAAER